MNIKDCGDYAFPCPSGCVGDYGMTLRDYFAGQALTGYLTTWTESAIKPERVAQIAYEIADAMIKARGEIET